MKKDKLFVSLLAAGMLAVSPALADDVVKITTNKQAGETVTLQVNQLKGGAKVDWGNGTTVDVPKSDETALTLTGIVAGETITITTPSKLEMLICEGQGVTALDLSGAPNLRSLYCQNNALTGLSLAATPLLLDLNCANNKIGIMKLDETVVPLIENLDISGNSMRNNKGNTSTAFTINTKTLKHLNVANNSFTSLSLSTTPDLDVLKCSNNKITSLTLRSDTLSALMCSDNALTSVSMIRTDGAARQNNLLKLFADNNKISKIDLSYAPKLKYVALENNNLSSVKLDRHSFYAYTCGNNKLGLTSMPTSSLIENFSYAPQNLSELNIGSKLQWKYIDGQIVYYMLTCPNSATYSQGSGEAKYVLKLHDNVVNGMGETGKIKAAYMAKLPGADEYTELARTKTFYKSTASLLGIVGFKETADDMYVQYTNEDYPDIVQTTTHFKVVASADDVVSGIHAVVNTAEGKSLDITAENGSLTIASASAQPVQVFSAEGRLVWKGIVEGTQTVQLGTGVYIVNGKKVIL